MSLCIRIQRILLGISEPWSKCSDGSQVWSCFCIIFIYPFLFKFVKINLLAFEHTNKIFTEFCTYPPVTLIASHYFDRSTSSLSYYSNQKEMAETLETFRQCDAVPPQLKCLSLFTCPAISSMLSLQSHTWLSSVFTGLMIPHNCIAGLFTVAESRNSLFEKENFRA